MTLQPPRQRTGNQTANAGYSLAAVGGPVGTGAGALRVIVEFLTQYDAKELKRLESDLSNLQKRELRQANQIAKLRREEAASQTALTRATNIYHRAQTSFTRAQLNEIKEIRDLERSRVRGDKARANAAKEALARQTGFTKAEISYLVNRDRIERRAIERRAALTEKIATAEGRVTKTQQAQVPIQERISRMQQVRQQLLPKLGSLALGAAGGVFGGALIGLGFAAAQAVIDSIGNLIQDLIDPSRHAREALKGVAEEINKLADSRGLSTLEATKEVLRGIGDAAAGVSPELIAQAVALQTVIENTEKLKDLTEIANNVDEIRQQQIRERVKLLREAAREAGNYPSLSEAASSRAGSDRLKAFEAQLLADAIAQVDSEARNAAGSTSLLERQEAALASTGAIAAISQQRLADALQNISGLRIGGLQDQLAALSNAGPSAQTLSLQNQLEGLAEAQAANAYQSQLAQIQEERALVLLEQRIRFQGESVNLDRLSARAQLVAIDARIAALNSAGDAERAQLDALNDQIEALRKADAAQDKRDQEELEVFDERIKAIQEEGDAQDRFNQLLDLQYRLGQKIKRNQGESIGDFLARRANEQRQLLAEQQQLQREGQINIIQAQRDEVAARQEVANTIRENAIEAKELEAERLQEQLERIEKARQAEIRALNEQRERLQLEVRLQEIAEREKTLNEQEGARKRQKSLQDQLKASQEADRKAVESRRKAIEDQIKAEQEKLERTLYWTRQENLERLRLAASGANTYAELQAISGEVAGARRVLGELRALVNAGVLPYSFVSERIANLVQIIRLAEGKMNQVIGGYRQGAVNSGFQPGFAQGGVFPLTNGIANPFGMNIRTGEAGQELGVVLSNRVARILRETSTPALPAQNFVINRSDDPFRDKSRFSRAVRDAVSDVLG